MRNLALHSESSEPSKGMAPRDRPRSSDRVLQLLCVIGASTEGLSLTEAAAKVGLVPSTALRQLRSLEAAGLLVRDGDDQIYRPGPTLIELSTTIFIGSSLVTVAQPFLDELAHRTGESAYLALAETPQSAVYIAKASGTHALRHSGWLGRGFASKSTAVGSALRGKTDADGVVSRVGVLEPGITAVSAPIRSSRGIVAAINVVGPSFRLSGIDLAQVRRAVAAAAIGLSGALGAQEGLPVALR